MVKLTSNDLRKPRYTIRSLDKYFWYISSDGVTQLATSSGTLDEISQQINDYILDPTAFAHEPQSSALPVWPPRLARDVPYALGPEGRSA
jgi:hypothetical protein